MGILLAVLSGALAFLVAIFFDLASLRRAPAAKRLMIPVFLALHGFALYAAIFSGGELALPRMLSLAGWVLAPVFTSLLAYSLFLELPARETYWEQGHSRRLVIGGTYALTRHPGVLWYVLLMASLVLATRSQTLLLAATAWSMMNILYAVLQDRFIFPRIFPDYPQYRRQVPMLLPTRKSLGACFRFLVSRGGIGCHEETR